MLELSKDYIWQTLVELNQLTPRWLGSKNEQLVRAYLLEKMEAVGLVEVHLEDFYHLAYIPVSASLTVTSPLTETLPCEPLAYSASASVGGRLVYVGSGSEEEFAELERTGIDFTGKIVAATTSRSFWMAPLAERHGAAAVIIITDSPEGHIRRLTARLPVGPYLHDDKFDGVPLKIPGVITNRTAGMRLLSLASVGEVVVETAHRAKYQRTPSANVVGLVRGFRLPDEKVVVGAHLDTQLAGGAWDNGTGLAGMLAIGRIMAARRPPRSVVFVGFAGEESGEWGSFNYVAAHRPEIDRGEFLAMCNLDSVSSMFGSTNTIWSSMSLREPARRAAEQVGWRVDCEEDFDSPIKELSDQCAFVEAGVPATWIWEQSNTHPYYHTEKDLLQYIDPDKLVNTLTVTAMLTRQIAQR